MLQDRWVREKEAGGRDRGVGVGKVAANLYCIGKQTCLL